MHHRPLLLQNALGGFRKARHAPGAAALGERISALTGQPAVGPRLLASLGERDQLSAAESKVAATAPNDEALNPTAGSARLNMEVESVAIAVSARRRRAHKRSREPQ